MLKTFEIVDVSIFKPSTGWFVAEARGGEKVVGTSIIPPFGWITVEATCVDDPRFGEQWKCKSVEYEDLRAVTLALLSSGLLKGINEGKAESVFKAFGSELWAILTAAVNADTVEYKNETRSAFGVLQEAKGVGKHVAKQMVESWVKEKFTFTAAISAIRCGLTVKQFRDIAMNDGGRERFYKMVHNEEPYNIYDLVNFGIDFEKVDKIAMTNWADKPAIEFDSPIRFSGAVKHAMRAWTKDGHLCAPVDDIERDVIDLIGAGNVMESLEKPETYGLKLFDGSVYLHGDYMMEVEFAQKLKQIVMTPSGIEIDIDATEVRDFADIDLHPTQVDAVLMALRNKVSVITGGPGVGKTTILKVITDILTDRGVPFQLGAFMGSAARRMRLATGYDASTLHSCFDLFQDKENRLSLRKGYLIIDEVSTISSDLAYDVVSCCFDEVSVLFIGDADQLPPVGRGEVFVQLLESKLPRTRLTHLYRNGGAIAAACRDVNQGKMPTPDNKDFFLINKCREADIPDRLTKAETYFNEQGWTGAQIITPMNDKYGVGRKALNSMMQKLRNPDGDVIPFTEIRTGDAVVHIKNNYELRVYNGMVGTCTSRTDDARVLLQKVLDRGENPVESFPDWTFQEEQVSVLEVMFEDETFPATYKANQLSELQLGYAITAHKAQGNQFPYVFVILPDLPPMLSLRQIVYTAMSRAKQKLVVIATPGVMERCITNTKILRRNSKLASFINEMYELEPA